MALGSLSSAQAGTFTVFGPEDFVRHSGSPDQFVRNFPATAGSYTLHIDNGGSHQQYLRIKSGSVKLNDLEVVGANDLKKAPATLDKTVTLKAQNHLEIDLNGDPGTGITLTLLGQDSVVPTIAITAPNQPVITNVPRPPVTVTYSDVLSGVDTGTLKIAIDGTTLAGCTVGAAAATCTPPALAAGNHTVTAQVKDRAGNLGTATFHFQLVLDTTPPTIAITSPNQPVITGNPIPTLAVSYSDAGTGVDTTTVKIAIDGTVLLVGCKALAATATCPPPSTLAAGNHTVTAQIKDKAGNLGTASFGFQLVLSTDTTPPALAITSPTQPDIYNQPAPTLGLAYSDTGTGVDTTTLQITLDGAVIHPSCTVGAAAASCPLPTLAAGVHMVAVTLRDRAGNQASVTASFMLVLDTTPPAVTFMTPVDGSFPPSQATGASAGLPFVAVQLRDDNSGVDPASIKLLVDGVDRTSAAQVSDQEVVFTPDAPFADGHHTAEVDATDLAGNITRSVVHFTLDSAPPVLSIVNPTAGGASGPIDITYSDALSGVNLTTLLVLLDDHDVTATCTAGPAEATCPLSALAPGPHHLAVVVFDGAANEATAAVDFGAPRDTTPPVVSITSPAMPLVSGNPSPAIAVAYADSGSGVDTATLLVTVDGAAVSCAAGPLNATCTTPPLRAGDHAVAAQIRDRAGNPATAGAHFTLVLPVAVAFTSPQPEMVTGLPVVKVTGVVAPQAVAVNVNGLAAVLNNGTFTIEAFGLHEGINNLVAVATDAAGNTGSASIRVTADTTPPIVGLTSPAGGDVVYTPTVTATGLVNDLTLGTVNQTEVTVTVNGVAAVVANRGFVAAGIGLAPGDNTLTAVAVDRAGNQATSQIHVTLASTSGVANLQAVSGDGQSARISTQLGNPLAVQATDATGAPLAGATVIFRVVQGDGHLAGGKRSLKVIADAQGLAAAAFILGSRAGAGVNRVSASAVGVTPQVTFAATATVDAPSAIHAASGDNQRATVGSDLADLLFAVVTDAGHNPVANTVVHFQVLKGGGGFAVAGGAPGVDVMTDGSGLASARLTLGGVTGLDNNLVQASLPGTAVHPVVFKASAFLPADPAQTAIKGVVLDNQSQPVPGVTLRLRDSAATTATDAQGKFRLAGVPVGQVFLIADASTSALPGSWASLEYEIFTLPGIDNALPKPVYILPLDLSHGIAVDETHGGAVTVPGLPGFELDVAPGSVTFPGGSRSGTISVTAVHADKIPMPPGAGMQPKVIVTIQPAGARFDPPAAMTLPNLDGLAPGSVTELFSFDHSIGAFVSIGTGTVSEDGMVVRSDPGFGVVQAGWHCGAPPGGDGDSASLDIEIQSDDPIVLAAPTAASQAAGAPAPDPIEADGTPAQDTSYTFDVTDSTVLGISPMGANLCANSSSCTTTPTPLTPGDVMVNATLTCQTTGETAMDQVEVIVGAILIKKVYSEQQPGTDCNFLDRNSLPPYALPESNNPILEAAAGDGSANISVVTHIAPDQAVPYARIGVRKQGTTNILADEAAVQDAKAMITIPATGGANLYEVVAGIDLDDDGVLDENEVTDVFPSQVRVFTSGDLSLAKVEVEAKKIALGYGGVLSPLGIVPTNPFFVDYHSFFLGDSGSITSGSLGSVPGIASRSLHHPLGAAWNVCQATLPLWSFNSASALSQKVANSSTIQGKVKSYLTSHAGDVVTAMDATGNLLATIPVNWSFSESVGGLLFWGTDTDLALVFGGLGNIPMHISSITVAKTTLPLLGTHYEVLKAAYDGSFTDLYNFDYYALARGQHVTQAEATVESSFPVPGTLGAGGHVLQSSVSFSYSGILLVNATP